MEDIQTGLPGLTVVSHVVMELNSLYCKKRLVKILKVTTNVQLGRTSVTIVVTLDVNVQRLVEHVKLTEAIQSGLPGLRVVSHVVMELNSVIDHAPIHRLQTMEHHAQELGKKHEYVPLNCVHS
ncbi:hypothetical protein ACROYT_G032352 [Oculina patagonica]